MSPRSSLISRRYELKQTLGLKKIKIKNKKAEEQLIREQKPQFTMKTSAEVCAINFYILKSVFTHCSLLLHPQMSVNMIIRPPRVCVSPIQ